MTINGYFITPFADTGDKTAIPDDTQPDGSVSFEQGFTSDYELPISDPDYKPVPRDETNQLYFDITTAIQQYQQKGVPPFITSVMNGGSPFSYSAGDLVISSGTIYASLADSNVTAPPGASWGVGRASYTLYLSNPIGTLYWNKAVSTNPATLFGFGTWTAITDKFIMARGATHMAAGGADTYTLLRANLPNIQLGAGIGDSDNPTSRGAFFRGVQACSATDSVTTDVGDATIEALTEALGSSTPFSILPTFDVAYCWERTA